MKNESIGHLPEKFSIRARRALDGAGAAASESESTVIRPIHLLSAILSEEGSLGNLFLVNAGIKLPSVRKEAVGIGTRRKRAGKRPSTILPFSEGTKDVLTGAFASANRFGSPYVGTEHVVHAILSRPDDEIVRILSGAGIDPGDTLSDLESHLGLDHVPDFGKLLDLPELSIAKRSTVQGGLPPSLSQFTVDLGRDTADEGGAFFGREPEISRIASILGRRQKNNPVLLGEPGVGKTAIVSAIARRIADGGAGAGLSDKRILALDLALVVAGTSFRGEFEARLKEIVREAKERPDIILFIDELHTIVGAGNAQGGLDAANILKPALARGEIRVIGATTPAEYRKHIEKDPALGRRFQPVSVREPSKDETRKLLRGIRPAYESFHGIKIDSPLLDLAVDLSVRYLHERFLPDKAIDILDEASSLAKNRVNGTPSARAMATLESARKDILTGKEALMAEGRFDDAADLLDEERRLNREIAKLSGLAAKERHGSERPSLSAHDLLETVSSMTGIPFSTLERDRPEQRLERLGRVLRSRIALQEDALSAVESSLLRSLSEIRDPVRPLGSLLFLGPTGVGKTLVAKTVAEEFFGGRDRLIRLDMSEFMERHSVAQMIGAPAGYVGYGEGGKLTERIRRMPHAVVLFDEIEKAHPDVAHILLQILDEGTLTDAEGRQVSFRDALIVITSNVGTSTFFRDGRIGFGKDAPTDARSHRESAKTAALEELKKTFRPELLARIDRTVVFDALDQSALTKIVRLELTALRKRLTKKGVTLSVPASVTDFLVKRSLAPEHGARLVRRNVEELVEKPVASALLSGSGPKRRFTLTLSGDTIACVEEKKKVSAKK
ncbi:MAG TPA: ATP-dependent Clp protease ATP-binding subunit [Candidatus Fimivivens sp.]|nr:ATP-dependent Clp protease ATP-binding subunit [Candidatus Fimivivens sp.]